MMAKRPISYAVLRGKVIVENGQLFSDTNYGRQFTARKIDSEVKRFVEPGLARARQILTEHVDQLHTIALALLEFETLTGEEIKRLIAGEDLGRDDPDAPAPTVAVAGTSIPKIRRPKNPFGNPTPQGA